MKRSSIRIILFCTTFLLWEDASAIPAFARKYNQSCNLCHVSIPKLNAFGEAFRFNGYRFPKETPEDVEEESVKLGGKVQKKLWPKQSVWPGEIPGTSPIAIRTMLDFNVSPSEKVESDFEFPHEVELLSGGNLGESISYFMEFVIYEKGVVGGLEKAFLQFDSPLWANKLFNLKIGQFVTSTVSSTHFRHIVMTHTIISYFQNSKNPFRLGDSQSGFEIWGIKDGRNGGGLYYSVGIVNGNGTNFADEQYDDNSAKDIYGRISYKVGGLSLSGESGEPTQGGSWRDNSFQVGSFGYFGNGFESKFRRVGADFRWQYLDLDLFGTALLGKDAFNDKQESIVSFSAYFLETDYVFLPWFTGAVRIEFAYTPDDDSIDDFRSMVGSVSFSIRPNVVLRLELEKIITGEKTATGRMRFDFAF